MRSRPFSPDELAGDRVRAGWSHLARQLTADVPEWSVWKGPADLDRGGDLDSVAPAERWPDVTASFRRWAARAGLHAVVACRHVPGQLILVGVDEVSGSLHQLDVVDRKLVHGAPAWSAAALLQVAAATDGIRRLATGAEGVARLLARPADVDAAALVARDPSGARSLARLLGLRGRLAVATRPGAATRVALELVLALRALRMPRSVASSIASDRPRARCAVLAALAAGRRADGPVATWLARVSEDHEVMRRA